MRRNISRIIGDQITSKLINGIIASFKENENVAFDERDDLYEVYIDGDYCNNNYTIRILEKFIID